MFTLPKSKFLVSSFNTLRKCWASTLQTCPSCLVERILGERAAIVLPKYIPSSFVHTSSPRHDLMEFFDAKENWGATEVKVGRAWKKEELRIKSNSDLHKLWFVLLKERNMLLSMEHEAKERYCLFPSPERLDKVEESMENLESVVRERNRAYFQLETGETGEREKIVSVNQFGLQTAHKAREHLIPQFMNTKWNNRDARGEYRGFAVSKFLRHYREKLFLQKERARFAQRRHVLGIMKRFPNVERKVLETHFPEVDIEKAALDKDTLGHHESNTA